MTMLSRSPLPEPSVVEPVAVMSGAGRVTVRLAGDAGQTVTLRMADASAQLLASLLAASVPAAPGTPAARAPETPRRAREMGSGTERLLHGPAATGCPL